MCTPHDSLISTEHWSVIRITSQRNLGNPAGPGRLSANALCLCSPDGRFDRHMASSEVAVKVRAGSAVTPGRLVSLDVFRGATIAAMILVNDPGGPGTYWPLEHAEWNGWTPTDLVFPFFLFIVGVAMAFSFPVRLQRGETR